MVLRLAWVVIGGLLLAGCAAHAGHHHGHTPPDPNYQEGSYEPQIPPGHLPPPGECRIWYPDRPPGHQPPPGPCHALQYQVPPGAYLVHG